MRKIFFLILSIITVTCPAQTEVNAYSASNSEGVTYYLPNTVLNITVEAQCITNVPGEFSRYADRFLRITDAITSEEKYWELSGINVKESGIPAQDKMFTIKLNGSKASNIHLNNNGIIESINTEVKEAPEQKTPVRNRTRVDARKYMTEEILQATSTAKMAELTAKEIYAIRESKMAITRGTADNMPKDGLSMQLILDELNTQETALTELFTGHKDTVQYTCEIKLTPTIESDTTKAVLFRFSRKLGILKNDDLAGKPIYYDFENMNSVPAPVIEEKKQIKKEGICYNIPGEALFKIYTAGDVWYEERLPIAQLGNVEILSKKLFNKNNETKVIFDTATGGIKSIDK